MSGRRSSSTALSGVAPVYSDPRTAAFRATLDRLRNVAQDYRRALPRAVERGTIFAAGIVIAAQAASPLPWRLVPLAFLCIAVESVVIALLIGVRISPRPSSGAAE